ncbi:hypothetical protein L2E82_10426 [Cichorium intybus]|uniref:Uncharacterized protein n=1 Tax=Cichorium intybus TaxID=13427 RepID=A0ACB9GBH8_CICIN|nr:hypothetical protein L2E82_10426 [Cichorium intybus]
MFTVGFLVSVGYVPAHFLLYRVLARRQGKLAILPFYSRMLYYFSKFRYYELDWVKTIEGVAMVAIMTTLVESLPTKGGLDDNISVPLEVNPVPMSLLSGFSINLCPKLALQMEDAMFFVQHAVNIVMVETYTRLLLIYPHSLFRSHLSHLHQRNPETFNKPAATLLVFPIKNLEIFIDEESERLICLNQLSDLIKFDHGYTASSPPIIHFLEVIQKFYYEQQKAFVKFVTGAPRLPIGGLASLNLKLTSYNCTQGEIEGVEGRYSWAHGRST